ncbi:hypothetical protein ACO0LB_02205 [Undibacterium sp. SXout7W]|uniref:hypothetical protein n=1 Tax=Undibacterium sp. SXout7W TaxID=3413049 RepID=UPI003BF3673D
MFDANSVPTSYSSSTKNTVDAARLDTLTARHIDTGLVLQATLGTSCAVEYLNGNGVPHQTIVRVLSQPDQHRPIANPM